MGANKPTYRFGVYELDAVSGELERQGKRVKLPEQPLRILMRLLIAPGQIVSRDALKRELWPDDTFVDFDLGINKAVRKLRRALGDSAENPRFIETLPKRGYRFIAPVETSAGPPTRSSKAGRRRTLAAAVLAGALLAGWLTWRRVPETASSEETTLAVLPFRDLGPPSDDGYFADGLTEEMTTHLGRLRSPGLRIISPSSVERYRDASKPVREIGEELGVDLLLLGSVRRQDDRVRVTARLVRARDGAQLWSDSFDAALDDVFEIQNGLARGISDALSLTLREPPSPVRPTSVEAYDAYLRGLYEERSFTAPAMRRAVEAFERAIALEPSFAPAHAASSRAYWMLAQPLLGMPYRGAMERAKQAALDAVELDPSLDTGHSALGWVRLWYDWDWTAAEGSFRRALALNPSSIEASLGLAFLFSATERHDEAIAEARRAAHLAPLGLGVRTALSELYLHARRYRDAAVECERVLTIDGDFQRAHLVLQWIAEAEGDFERAAVAHERFLLTREGGAATRADGAPAVAGRLAYWQRLHDEAEPAYREGRLHPTYWSSILAGLGDTDGAFEALEEAFRQRSGDLILLRVATWYDPLREDARFPGLVERVPFPR